VLLSCASFHPGSDTSINISGFCDKPIDTQMDAALSTEQTSMTQANTMWGQVDKAIMAQAPTAPLFTPKLIDFTSSRIKHYEFSKQFYMLVDQLWVK
jgi:peptide/nickel transport system substrate-binding protein